MPMRLMFLPVSAIFSLFAWSGSATFADSSNTHFNVLGWYIITQANESRQFFFTYGTSNTVISLLLDCVWRKAMERSLGRPSSTDYERPFRRRAFLTGRLLDTALGLAGKGADNAVNALAPIAGSDMRFAIQFLNLLKMRCSLIVIVIDAIDEGWCILNDADLEEYQVILDPVFHICACSDKLCFCYIEAMLRLEVCTLLQPSMDILPLG